MHVRFSDTAEADLDHIYTYIAEQNPRAANRMIDAILISAHQLGHFPFLGRLGRMSDTRELKVPRTPYIIVYTLPDAYHVDIETILHERRCYPPIGEA